MGAEPLISDLQTSKYSSLAFRCALAVTLNIMTAHEHSVLEADIVEFSYCGVFILLSFHTVGMEFQQVTLSADSLLQSMCSL